MIAAKMPDVFRLALGRKPNSVPLNSAEQKGESRDDVAAIERRERAKKAGETGGIGRPRNSLSANASDKLSKPALERVRSAWARASAEERDAIKRWIDEEARR